MGDRRVVAHVHLSVPRLLHAAFRDGVEPHVGLYKFMATSIEGFGRAVSGRQAVITNVIVEMFLCLHGRRIALIDIFVFRHPVVAAAVIVVLTYCICDLPSLILFGMSPPQTIAASVRAVLAPGVF